MCGRFTLTADAEAIQLAFGLSDVSVWEGSRYNIAPSQMAPVITNHNPRALTLLKWGLVPYWAKDPAIGNRMINARSETVAEKTSFRTAFKKRRCLIPADGFFEWAKRNGKKAPMYIKRRDRAIFALAGLWENWQQPDGPWLGSCSILTTEANDFLRPIHHRMPVMIEPEDYDTWLSDEVLSPQQWLPLMTGCASEQMTAFEVSTLVNRAINNNPAVIAPVDTDIQQQLF